LRKRRKRKREGYRDRDGEKEKGGKRARRGGKASKRGGSVTQRKNTDLTRRPYREFFCAADKASPFIFCVFFLPPGYVWPDGWALMASWFVTKTEGTASKDRQLREVKENARAGRVTEQGPPKGDSTSTVVNGRRACSLRTSVLFFFYCDACRGVRECARRTLLPSRS
jgi:hypothetical protein